MNTIYGDPTTGDLALDANGDIALATEPFSIALDVTSAVLTFAGEVYYDTTMGIPYWDRILGHLPPLELIRSLYIAAAKTVPDVVEAKVFFSGLVNRKLSGQMQVTNTAGVLSVTRF